MFKSYGIKYVVTSDREANSNWPLQRKVRSQSLKEAISDLEEKGTVALIQYYWWLSVTEISGYLKWEFYNYFIIWRIGDNKDGIWQCQPLLLTVSSRVLHRFGLIMSSETKGKKEMSWKTITRRVVVTLVWIMGIFYTGKTIKGNFKEFYSHRSFMAIESYGKQG